jgi:dienelactone hydrolase
MGWVRSAFLVGILMPLLTGASLRSQEILDFTGLEIPHKQLTGTLTLPGNRGAAVPIVVLVHGTAGVDSRYAFHKPALLEAGIGTLEVDFKTDVFTGGSDRPPISSFQPWAFGALRALRAHPRIDVNRIAIMGFSMGGHLSVSVSSKKVVEHWLGPERSGFAAHVAFYPACLWLEKYFDAGGVTGAPILILAGELDSWGDGDTCPEFAGWLNESHSGVVSLTIYPNVHHGFDREGSWEGYAPYARNRTGILRWNAEAAYDSRKRVVAFLRQAFDR